MKLLSFAALTAAQRKKAAAFAPFVKRKTLPDELFRLFACKRSFNRSVFNIAEQPFVGTEKVARIKIAVALNNKLMCAVAAKTALLRLFSKEHSDPIIKKADADIVAPDKVLDIEIECFYQESGVLLACHIKFALALIAERAQARYELQILKAVVAEILIHLFAPVGAISGQHNKNIELNSVLSELFGGFENFEV